MARPETGEPGWRGRLRFRDLVLADRWFPADARITAGEAPSASFVVPALAAGDGPAVLVADGRPVFVRPDEPPTSERPLRVSPPDCPDVAIELWPAFPAGTVVLDLQAGPAGDLYARVVGNRILHAAPGARAWKRLPAVGEVKPASSCSST